ncbi:DUF4097 family beta strand repeat-containing protein [Lysinibacillus endophyticus]|uniref:DUF4097 family beta strand repeat-containing protein n=1 Tax=Ureibacillus endophyticus TaxID=1978490 RepID=UPI00209EA0D2|nr:DUF4097 family beta strand repeat-containing protein [Lysinibacillus endophyticus]MCP1143780.1 DUF4097 family beta strand repeat-containing protein [Lysinibacillus endophyticus]
MENERKRILSLVENGTITAEEAIVLLEALTKEKGSKEAQTIAPISFEKESESKASQQTSNESKSTGFEDLFGKSFNNKEANKKMDEFFNDLKEDLSHFSHRVVNLMNSTFTKLKDIDLEFPFGEKVQFQKNYAFNAEDINGLELEIPNGKVDIVKADDQQFTIDAQVKTSLQHHSEERTIAEFEEKFIKLVDGKLTISVPTKMSHVDVRLAVPEKQYDIMILRLLNGSVSINDVNSKLIKAKSYNGSVKIDHVSFQHADIETGNGAIELRNSKGEDLEAETVNGRIYIDGDVEEVEAESVNGAVVVTTHSQTARKIKAQTVAGAVEIYVPKSLSLAGQVTTNFGKADVGLADVVTRSEEDQFLLKTLHFDKIIENANLLKLTGESRTGSIIVRYIAE